MPDQRTGVHPEPPPVVLRDYALLADGERGALVDPHGGIVWMCAPRWDSDAVLSALLGGAGAYTVGPVDPWHVWGGHYEEGTLIWRSRWMTRAGAIECREALAFPGDPHTAVLLRRIEAIDGPARVRVALDVRARFGACAMENLSCHDGVWEARSGGLYVRWSGAGDARSDLALTLTVPHGGHHDLVLEVSDRPFEQPASPACRLWEGTENQWRGKVPKMEGVLGGRDARRACAVLLGMTSRTGATVAAATTSLPERAEAGRNYDYRFSWIRDQCYVGHAAAAVGPEAFPLLDAAVGFIAERVLTDGPQLRPAYTLDGGIVPDERELPQLLGFPGGGNRVGNGINDKFQLDALGEALLLFAAAAEHGRLEGHHWRAAECAAAAIERRRDDPETGIWELDRRRWTHSQLICSAGLRAVARAGAAGPQAARWTALADSLLARAASDCVHPSGRWQRSPGDEKADAALLLAAIRGALPADDPRSVATLRAVREDLTQDGYVYRFRHDDRPLGKAEGAFLLCNFFTALATRQQGEEAEARGYFERARAACGPAGLFSEEYDVGQRQLRGNLPQAFVHALLMETGARLSAT
ncbi:glycoside hydrolase family 15 protein [Streptomyces tubbatahanensis]|uniref:Glycoside hydrolase family 15 protein n=1 Tax=Streptomyces tubbatahanensis TaxID=2923272 RepID=A0ABY3XNA1_9ACTN|nr:glycoside hydrolase family 15 protein [Streptomyces tubbatahanensis]UNS95869.1 glycoside hydrolase family 15 protein [Streptomyces tubbatahanensis]